MGNNFAKTINEKTNVGLLKKKLNEFAAKNVFKSNNGTSFFHMKNSPLVNFQDERRSNKLKN